MTKKITYNVASKEFQEEANRLGLTGYQLMVRYSREGKLLKKGQYIRHCNQPKYTERQLLDPLLQFYDENGVPPTTKDFSNNSRYPSVKPYVDRYGNWQNALKLVELDFESMVKKGIVETTQQIGRFGEITVRDHFENNPVDLSGDNCNSSYDGICPNGKTYDVKSSKFDKDGKSYTFAIYNVYREEIEIYYLLGFNKDHTKLDYGWRIPGEITERCSFIINTNRNSRGEFTIYNMKQYDITDKLRDVLIEHGYFEEIKNYRKTLYNLAKE